MAHRPFESSRNPFSDSANSDQTGTDNGHNSHLLPYKQPHRVSGQLGENDKSFYEEVRHNRSKGSHSVYVPAQRNGRSVASAILANLCKEKSGIFVYLSGTISYLAGHSIFELVLDQWFPTWGPWTPLSGPQKISGGPQDSKLCVTINRRGPQNIGKFL